MLPESGGSRPFDGATAPGDAINFAVPLFSTNAYDGRRWKIDLSADGKWNDGINPATARDNALTAGVDAINAIVVSDDNSVVDFYRDNVIKGSGAFVSQTNDFTGFEQGIYQKLTTELTPLPLLSIGDVSLQEGDSGTTDFIFDVTLSETSTEDITVNYATANDTAVAGKDYTATSGTLNFAAGETSKQVTVSVTGENRLEIDENFLVNLSNANNAEISDAEGKGIIFNDDEILISKDSVDENSPEGTVVGLLSATDPGDTDPFTFRLINDAGGRFKIVGNELQVANGELLDFETNTDYDVIIRATDSKGNNFDKTFTIQIKDVNEGPSFGGVYNIEENSDEGDFVAQLGATDPEGDTLEYAIISGNTDPDGDGTAAFAIDGATGKITVADSGDLDFETTPTFNLNLTVTDEDGLSDNARITINLADVDESQSLSIQNATFSVEENSEEETVVGIVPAETSSNEAVLSIIENQPPIADDAIFDIEANTDDETIVGTVTATDAEKEALTFAIISGNLDPDRDNNQAFAIDPLTGAIIVKDSDDLDFETNPSFNLQVTATDSGGLSDTAEVKINLIDIPTVEFAQDNSQNGFFALTGGDSNNLKFTVNEVGSDNINEVGLFIVDDENGNINGIAPGSEGYVQAALEKAQVIFSAISDIPSSFNLGEIERILEVDSDAFLGFYMTSNASTNTVLTELESTGTTTVPLF
ncbi:MAG: cadherin domain-containing protein, partial [Cyanobacteria bacterium J06636_27]